MMDATFAKDWEAAWNSHDLERILSHYTDDIVFRSRKADALVGQGELRGKLALANYWRAALERQPNLTFRVEAVFAGHDMLTILYRNHADVLATEVLYFNADGLVYRAAACHEIAL